MQEENCKFLGQKISEIVSLAAGGVEGENFSFVVDFVEKMLESSCGIGVSISPVGGNTQPETISPQMSNLKQCDSIGHGNHHRHLFLPFHIGFAREMVEGHQERNAWKREEDKDIGFTVVK